MTFSDAIAAIPNHKHRRFVEQFLLDLDGAKAAGRAGFRSKNLSHRAWSLKQRPEIARAIEIGQQEMSERVEVKQDKILQEYLNVGFCDIAECFDESGNLKNIHDIPKAIRMAISGIDVIEQFSGDGEDRTVSLVKKIRFWDKLKALDALGRHLGLFNADESRKPVVNALVALLQRIDGQDLPQDRIEARVIEGRT